ncbi:MAG: 5-oxoprolinase subunit B family protein [Roseinatronobacter sp.]
MTVRISDFGVDAVLISFADHLTEAANRAALAFRAAIEAASLTGVEDVSTTLVSVLVRNNPGAVERAALLAQLAALSRQQEGAGAGSAQTARLWDVPCVFGTDLAPQLSEAAALAGLTPEDAITRLTARSVRVQTIGFAPRQPYLGLLDSEWKIPRRTTLTSQVPVGAVTVAIRQVVLFSFPSPTGWRHVGRRLCACSIQNTPNRSCCAQATKSCFARLIVPGWKTRTRWVAQG